MEIKRVIILGGYGSTGRPLAELLLQETSAELILAGRNEQKAQALAVEFNEKFEGQRVVAKRVDASDTKSIRQAFAGVDMVVVASSTADYTEQVANAALDAGIDYFDVLYATQKFETLQALAPRIEEAGLCFITVDQQWLFPLVNHIIGNNAPCYAG
jgi:saccharopine dehydrogenase-like NADP-dependent oxidoreductase